MFESTALQLLSSFLLSWTASPLQDNIQFCSSSPSNFEINIWIKGGGPNWSTQGWLRKSDKGAEGDPVFPSRNGNECHLGNDDEESSSNEIYRQQKSQFEGDKRIVEYFLPSQDVRRLKNGPSYQVRSVRIYPFALARVPFGTEQRSSM
jgi:hypothetical protein